MEDVIDRMRTFTILNWCGMPFELNPRKCAKMGYICVAECRLACSDKENCGAEISLSSELAFRTDRVAIERALM